MKILPDNNIEIILFFIMFLISIVFSYFLVIKSKWLEYRVRCKIVRDNDYNKLNLTAKCPYNKNIYFWLCITALAISILISLMINSFFFNQLALDNQKPIIYQLSKFLEILVFYYILMEIPITSETESMQLITKPLKILIEMILKLLIFWERTHLQREIAKDIREISIDKEASALRICNLIARLNNKSFVDRYNLSTDASDKLQYNLKRLAKNHINEYEIIKDDLAYLIQSFLPKSGMAYYDLAMVIHDTTEGTISSPIEFLREYSYEVKEKVDEISQIDLENQVSQYLDEYLKYSEIN